MIKTRILLASVLKPINDTRMFEKLGLSLGKLPDNEVHLCGFEAPLPTAPTHFVFHPLFKFSRLSISRLLVPIKFLSLLFRLKPHLLIVGTHELLLPGILYKCFRKCDLVYDIQENYYLNISTQQVYPIFIRNILAKIIRATEQITAPYVQTFFLAEKSYEQELPFLKNRYLILENKYKPLNEFESLNIGHENRVVSEHIQLLYSGTISEVYGIYDAIELAKRLHASDARFSLTIIGYCHQLKVLERIKTDIRDKPFIKLIGGDQLVPHAQIIEAIQQSQVGVLPYHAHPSISRCVPTKLFEYLAHALPVIAPPNPYWKEIINSSQAGIQIDFDEYQPTEIIQKLKSGKFYMGTHKPDVFWETEETKLLRWFKSTYTNYPR